VVIGGLIWFLGEFAKTSLLGLGGLHGLGIYSAFVVAIVGGIGAIVTAAQRGVLWIRPLQRWVTSLPGLGKAIQKLCLARMTWTLHLLLNVDRAMRKVMPLVLRATGNDYYIQHTKR